MFVKPAPGRMVRHPDKGTFLPENGAEVPDNAIFWRNRLRDGDVVKVEKASLMANAGKKPGKTPGSKRKGAES